mmetsp:Transcript_18460/g.29888  ORF Transcript_18460/g.29888 Transcript_18460/m.29888 type:complete len:210 (-) Transcript_18460:319-948(-)
MPCLIWMNHPTRLVIHPLHLRIIQHVRQAHLLPFAPLPEYRVQIRQQCPQLFLLAMLLSPRFQFGFETLPHQILFIVGVRLLGFACTQFLYGLLLRPFHVVDTSMNGRSHVGGLSGGVGSVEGYSLDPSGGTYDPAVTRRNARIRPGGGGCLRLSVLHRALHPTFVDVVPHPTGRGLFLSVLTLELLRARFPRLCSRGRGRRRQGGGVV